MLRLQWSCFLVAVTFISFLLPWLCSASDDAQNHYACDIHTACGSTQVTDSNVCRAAVPICLACFFNYSFHFLFKMTVFARFEVCIAVLLSIPFFSGLTQRHWVKGFLLTRRHPRHVCLPSLNFSLCVLGLSAMNSQIYVRRRRQKLIACVESEGLYCVSCIVA